MERTMKCAHCDHEVEEHFVNGRERCAQCEREGAEFVCEDFDH